MRLVTVYAYATVDSVEIRISLSNDMMISGISC